MTRSSCVTSWAERGARDPGRSTEGDDGRPTENAGAEAYGMSCYTIHRPRRSPTDCVETRSRATSELSIYDGTAVDVATSDDGNVTLTEVRTPSDDGAPERGDT